MHSKPSIACSHPPLALLSLSVLASKNSARMRKVLSLVKFGTCHAVCFFCLCYTNEMRGGGMKQIIGSIRLGKEHLFFLSFLGRVISLSLFLATHFLCVNLFVFPNALKFGRGRSCRHACMYSRSCKMFRFSLESRAARRQNCFSFFQSRLPLPLDSITYMRPPSLFAGAQPLAYGSNHDTWHAMYAE